MAFQYKHKLMFVDDEAPIINSLLRLFRNSDYEIITAKSGEEGIQILKEMATLPSLILSDQKMTGISGVQFLEEAKKICPDAKRILLTGYSDMDVIIDAVNKGGIHRYLAKPWNDEELISQIRQAIEQYELILENRRLTELTTKQNEELLELNKNLEAKVAERSQEILIKNKALSRLNLQLETSLYNTVRALGSLIERYSRLQGGHGRRVAETSRKIAQLLKLEERDINFIEIAALLHDIGKLGFPEKMLVNTYDKFNHNEQEMYRKHTLIGQETVHFINDLNHVGLLIRSHHEQYDGEGFPDQLSREEIPMGARIIAVADAYDKVVHLKMDMDGVIHSVRTTDRYLAEDTVLQKAAVLHLKQKSLLSYDPDIVNSFFDYLKNENKYKEERKLPVADLREGMILSRPLYNSDGRYLLPQGTVLTSNYIQKLRLISISDPLLTDIYVLRS